MNTAHEKALILAAGVCRFCSSFNLVTLVLTNNANVICSVNTFSATAVTQTVKQRSSHI